MDKEYFYELYLVPLVLLNILQIEEINPPKEMLRKLNEIRALKDPIKQSQVEFIISDTPGLLLAKLQQKIVGVMSGNMATTGPKELRLRCTSYGYPGAKVSQTELVIAGHVRRLGQVQDRSGTWTVEVTEDYEGSVLNTIEAWCDIIHSPVAGTRLPSSLYKTVARIQLGGNVKYPFSGKKLGMRTLWLRGVYPISYEVGNLNPSDSSPVSVKITFNYDWFGANSYSLVNGVANLLNHGIDSNQPLDTFKNIKNLF